jgi:hypothetical protein
MLKVAIFMRGAYGRMLEQKADDRVGRRARSLLYLLHRDNLGGVLRRGRVDGAASVQLSPYLPPDRLACPPMRAVVRSWVEGGST